MRLAYMMAVGDVVGVLYVVSCSVRVFLELCFYLRRSIMSKILFT